MLNNTSFNEDDLKNENLEPVREEEDFDIIKDNLKDLDKEDKLGLLDCATDNE